ncbi:sensor histidine kinase [Micromonospora sp. CPCC 206061]|uniref:sensor histidine kinase n=1 Tax=Micromonospora sp. CPCC 206061 TaxID=3122410 RepID=UPI003FA5E609
MGKRTVRQRFTVLYAVLFLLSGLALLVLTNLLTGLSSTEVAAPANPPAEQSVAAAQARVHELQARLSDLRATQSRQLMIGSVIALVVMAAVSILVGKVVADRVLRPLRTITAATQRISADNLHERLGVPGPADEVKDLADTIDGLLERLEASFVAQRRFVANASHELRTPLTTLRASLDVALAKPEPAPPQTVALAGRVRAELDRVDSLLEGFLDLARAQHGVLPDRAPVSLSTVASKALAARAADIGERNVTVEADVRDAAWTEGSLTLLSRMANNLIDNAVIHNQRGGWIRVAAGARNGSAELVVQTSGPVLDPEQVAGSPSPSSGSPPTAPAPTPAPVSACRSSPPSSPRTAATWTCDPGPKVACASPSTCRRAGVGEAAPGEGTGGRGRAPARRRRGRGPARSGHGRRRRPRRPDRRHEARRQRVRRGRPRP